MCLLSNIPTLPACYHGGKVEDDLSILSNKDKMYKVSSFKSWLLYPFTDSRYAPLHLNNAVFPPRERNMVEDYQNLREEKYLTEGALLQDIICQNNKNAETNEAWPIVTYPTRSNHTHNAYDINLFIEKLNVQELAKICYNTQQGKIYYIRGYRPEYKNYINGLIAGSSPPIIAQPYIPVLFFTDSALDLSVLMDNIWLLYQLSSQKFIKMNKTTKSWEWAPIAYKQNSDCGKVLATLSTQLSSRYKVLKLIKFSAQNNILPHLAFFERKTSEPCHSYIFPAEKMLNDTQQYLLDDHHKKWPKVVDICQGKIFVPTRLAANKSIEYEVKGREIWTWSHDKLNAMRKRDPAFKLNRSMIQYDLLTLPSMLDQYPKNKVKVELIYNS